jgi:serine/threonine-protein kinase RsbW
LTAPPPKIELTVPRTTQYLGMVRRVVAMAAERVGFEPTEVDMIELAIDEACSNAVIYGTSVDGQLKISVEITDVRFTVVLSEDGPRFPFEDKGNFNVEEQLGASEHGGLGIYIIKRFMDEVSYTHSDECGNVITMTKLRSVPV